MSGLYCNCCLRVLSLMKKEKKVSSLFSFYFVSVFIQSCIMVRIDVNHYCVYRLNIETHYTGIKYWIGNQAKAGKSAGF